MSDHSASRVGLALIAVGCVADVILEAGLAVHYLSEGRQEAGVALAVACLLSFIAFSWLAYDTRRPEAPSVEQG